MHDRDSDVRRSRFVKVQEMQLATSDLGNFLVALHAPSTRPSGACGHGSPYTVPWFTLVTLDGSVLRPNSQ
jgi:hypothetical protein